MQLDRLEAVVVNSENVFFSHGDSLQAPKGLAEQNHSASFMDGKIIR